MRGLRWTAIGGALGLACLALGAAGPLRTQSPSALDWRPNKPPGDVHYVGARVCAQCHSARAESQAQTPMARALIAPAHCDTFATQRELTYRDAKFAYVLGRDGGKPVFSVRAGDKTLTAPVFYCFGAKDGGQTYVLAHEGKLYESRLSVYTDSRGLDLTPGHMPTLPTDLDSALGRVMDPAETRACFGCHSTNALDPTEVRFDRLIAGVSCEACHGPGEKHVAALARGDVSQLSIFNPGRLDAEGQADFCGTCHRTWEQVALSDVRGVSNVRFQPYRLQNSKCFDRQDARIGCLACHDPHEHRKQDASFYDAKCRACHDPAAAAQAEPRHAPSCPRATSQCVSCHMPRYALPGGHLRFSDHYIRVVRPGETYPN
jgi:Cytochrome c554 and c-prime